MKPSEQNPTYGSPKTPDAVKTGVNSSSPGTGAADRSNEDSAKAAPKPASNPSSKDSVTAPMGAKGSNGDGQEKKS